MGLLFTALSTVSLLEIPRDKMAQASAITNSIRQLGGSLGVALLATLLTSRTNFHTQVYGGLVVQGSGSLPAKSDRDEIPSGIQRWKLTCCCRKAEPDIYVF